jgi:hypothetical protein
MQHLVTFQELETGVFPTGKKFKKFQVHYFNYQHTTILAPSILPATNSIICSLVSAGHTEPSVEESSVLFGGLTSARRQCVAWIGRSSKSDGKPRILKS